MNADELDTAIPALERAAEELDTAAKLLNEVYTIGLWVKSDDSSDNRRKRTGLREADWAVSGAQRALATVKSVPEIAALETEIAALVTTLERLPDEVTDTMGENLSLDASIMAASRQVEDLRDRSRALATAYRERHHLP